MENNVTGNFSAFLYIFTNRFLYSIFYKTADNRAGASPDVCMFVIRALVLLSAFAVPNGTHAAKNSQGGIYIPQGM